MRQKEFLRELETGLCGRISQEETADILAEYRSFFVSGIAEGKSEEEICALLGSPAALVHSLADTGSSSMSAPQAPAKVAPAHIGKRIAATLIDRLFLLLLYSVVLIPSLLSFLAAQASTDGQVSVGMTIGPSPFLMGFILLIGLPFSPLTLLPMATVTSLLVSGVLRLLDMGPGIMIGILPGFYVLVFLLLSLYKPLAESLSHGQTLGKRLMGLRVTAADGSRVSAGAIWRRELLGDILLGTITLGIAPIVSSFLAAGKSRRSLPDRIADTVVMETAALKKS